MKTLLLSAVLASQAITLPAIARAGDIGIAQRGAWLMGVPEMTGLTQKRPGEAVPNQWAVWPCPERGEVAVNRVPVEQTLSANEIVVSEGGAQDARATPFSARRAVWRDTAAKGGQ